LCAPGRILGTVRARIDLDFLVFSWKMGLEYQA
jgi:hypothetical protein